MKNQGCLAVWTEVSDEHLDEYRRWLTQEHMQQRVALPGFFGVRLFASVTDERAHFILYSTENSAAFLGDAYLAILNDPTPWTRQMMPRLKGFDRGAGSLRMKVQDGTGAWLLVARLRMRPQAQEGAIRSAFASITAVSGVVTASLYDVDRGSTDAPTTEKTMRTAGEGAFEALLLIEATSEKALAGVRQGLGELGRLLGVPRLEEEAQPFRALFALHPFEGATA